MGWLAALAWWLAGGAGALVAGPDWPLAAECWPLGTTPRPRRVAASAANHRETRALPI